jgi:hypothetical protein
MAGRTPTDLSLWVSTPSRRRPTTRTVAAIGTAQPPTMSPRMVGGAHPTTEPAVAEIIIQFDVDDVDPARVDPHDIANYLLGLHDIEMHSGNAPFILGESSLQAEWADQ